MSFNIFHSAVFFFAIAIFAIALFTLVFRIISTGVGSKKPKAQKRPTKRTYNHGLAHNYGHSDDGFMQRTETMNDFVRQENERQFNSFMSQSIADNNSFNDTMVHQMDTMNTINDINMMNMNGFM